MTEEMVPPNVREDLKVWVMKGSRSICSIRLEHKEAISGLNLAKEGRH